MKRTSVWFLLGLGTSALLPAQTQPGFQEFAVAAGNPVNIASGTDGALWFTAYDPARIGRIATDGTVTEFSLSSPPQQSPWVPLGDPYAIVAGPDGNLWFTDPHEDMIGKINTNGYVWEYPIVAGNSIGYPRGITLGPNAEFWFTEFARNKIGKIKFEDGTPSECGPTTSGQPEGITFGPDGALWFTESSDTADYIGQMTASCELKEYPLVTGSLPQGITVGPDGALWFAEAGTNRIGRITTSGGLAESASTGLFPRGITVGPDGALWFTEFGGDKIGRIATIDGPISEFPVPNGAIQPEGIVAGPDAAVWVALNAGGIDRVVLSPPNTTNYIITTVAGNGSTVSSGDGGPATSAGIKVARGVAVDQLGNLYVTDGEPISGAIRKVDAYPPHNIHTVAGDGQQGLQGNQVATSVMLSNPWGVAVDNSGTFYIAESGGRWVDSVSGGIINVVSTQLNSPDGLAVNSAGSVYVADSGNCRIVELTPPNSNPTPVAGWTCGHSGDGTAANAQLLFPEGVGVDQSGNNVYIADTGNHQIRKVTSGTITRVAGSVDSSGTPLSGYSGDTGPATSARLDGPTDVAVDSAGNLYIADYYNAVIRKVDFKSQNIYTIAGGGSPCSASLDNVGDGCPAKQAILSFPYHLAVDAVGDIFVGDAGTYRFRKLTPVPVIPTPTSIFAYPGGTTAGGPAFIVLVHGLNYLVGSKVQWNGSALLTAFMDTQDLLAVVPANLTAGSASLTVLSPDGSVSNGVNFMIAAAPTPAPVSITGLSPSSTAAGGPAFTLTVNGTGFTVGAAVLFDGASMATAYVSATQLTAAIPAAAIASAHTASVTVSNPQGGVSNAVNFAVAAANGLTIVTPSPLASGVVGSSYGQALYASGGATPYKSWAVINGNLPPGISLITFKGIWMLTGRPTTQGTFFFAMRVTDNAGTTATKQFSLTVNGGGGAPPA
ncbi:MAG TPA: putative Ig domain-containing protein [Bryobacteraceae bacterium]|nr:putative Ig domain-containing protein [Bryobacteraceae bacterium]